jgi:hypothetical protein
VPFESPYIEQAVQLEDIPGPAAQVEKLPNESVAVAVYEVTGAPPLLFGALHETSSEPTPVVTLTSTGTEGELMAMAEAVDPPLTPLAFVAVTYKA